MNDDQQEQLERELSFAAMGKQVLSNAAYQQAMTTRKAQIFDVFCRTGQEQSDIREEAWRTMKNLDAIEEYFRVLLETGKMAEETLKLTEK